MIIRINTLKTHDTIMTQPIDNFYSSEKFSLFSFPMNSMLSITATKIQISQDTDLINSY
jgi:hypothetical protein